eukprot:364439-Chlamydomonas_euryale.AAC.2
MPWQAWSPPQPDAQLPPTPAPCSPRLNKRACLEPSQAPPLPPRHALAAAAPRRLPSKAYLLKRTAACCPPPSNACRAQNKQREDEQRSFRDFLYGVVMEPLRAAEVAKA